jgi:hypothetical protein
MVKFIKNQDSVNEVMFVGAPLMYGDFGTLRFLLRNIRIIDIIDPIQGDNPEIRANDQSIYIFHPARRDEFDLIQKLWGPGEHGRVFSDTGEILFFWYRPI